MASRYYNASLSTADQFHQVGQALHYPPAARVDVNSPCHVRTDGKGSYSWVQIEFGPLSKVENQAIKETELLLEN
jgi:hypothetical protein